MIVPLALLVPSTLLVNVMLPNTEFMDKSLPCIKPNAAQRNLSVDGQIAIAGQARLHIYNVTPPQRHPARPVLCCKCWAL
jgi:hypothetical protein